MFDSSMITGVFTLACAVVLTVFFAISGVWEGLIFCGAYMALIVVVFFFGWGTGGSPET